MPGQLKGKQIKDNSLDLEKLRSGSKLLPSDAKLGTQKAVGEITDAKEFVTKEYVENKFFKTDYRLAAQFEYQFKTDLFEKVNLPTNDLDPSFVACIFAREFVYTANRTTNGQTFLYKINPNDLTDHEVLAFPNDTRHRYCDSLIYNAKKGKIYAVFGDVTYTQTTVKITEIDPITLAYNDIITDNIGALTGPAPYATTDGDYLYVITFYYNPRVLKYDLSNNNRIGNIAITNWNSVIGRFLEYDGKFLYAGSIYGTVQRIAKIDPVSFTFINEANIGIGAVGPSDDIALVGDYIWFGVEGSALGQIIRVRKDDFTKVDVMYVGFNAICAGIAFDGTYIWGTFTNGKMVKINPMSLEMITLDVNMSNNIIEDFITDGNRIYFSWEDEIGAGTNAGVGRITIPNLAGDITFLNTNATYKLKMGSDGTVSIPTLNSITNYSGNFSGSYTNRSIVDKEYVDTKIANVTSVAGAGLAGGTSGVIDIVGNGGIQVNADSIEVDFQFVEDNKLVVSQSTSGRPVEISNLEWKPLNNALSILGSTSGNLNAQLIFNDYTNIKKSHLEYSDISGYTSINFTNYYTYDIGFFDENIGIISAARTSDNQGVILRTTNKGLTWIPIVIPDVLDITTIFIEGSNAIVGGVSALTANSSVFITSNNNGATWSTPVEIIGMNNINRILKFLTTYYAVGSHGSVGAIITSSDGGATWSVPSDIHDGVKGMLVNSFFFRDDLTLIAVGRHYNGVTFDGSYAISTDNGNSWNVYIDTNYKIFNDVENFAGYLWITGKSDSNKGTILKSNDNGTTWSATTFNDSNNLYDIEFNSSNNPFIVGLDSDFYGAVWKSNDLGVTWEKTTITGAGDLSSLTFNPSDTNQVHAVGYDVNTNNGYLISSYNVGETGQGLKIYQNGDVNIKGMITNLDSPKDDSDAVNKAYVDQKIDNAVFEGNGINIEDKVVSLDIENYVSKNNINLKSPNIVLNGTNSITIIGNDVRYDNDYSGSYTNRSLVDKEYVDNKSNFGYTADNKITVTDSSNGTPIQVDNLEWKPDDNTLEIHTNNSSSGALRFNNISNNLKVSVQHISLQGWTNISPNTDFDIMNYVHFKNSSSGYIAGQNRLSISTDSGATWSNTTLPNTSYIHGVEFTNNNNGVVFASNLSFNPVIYKTTDGQNWTSAIPVTSGLDFTLPSNTITHQVIDFNTYYLFGAISSAGSGGRMIKTSDGGTNWSLVGNTLGSDYFFILDNYFSDANTGYIAGFDQSFQGRLSKTVNGGTNWTHTTYPTLGSLWGITFSDSNTGYAVGVSNSSEGVVVKTTDGGNSWSSPTVIANTSLLRAVTFVNNDIGYVGGQDINGNAVVYKTENGGNSWVLTHTSTTGYFRNATNTSTDNIYMVGTSDTSDGIVSYTLTGGEQVNKIQIFNNTSRGMLTNLASPSNLYDAVNKEYVDNATSNVSTNAVSNWINLKQTGFGVSGTSGVVSYLGTFNFTDPAKSDAEIFVNGVRIALPTDAYFGSSGNAKPQSGHTLYFDLNQLGYIVDSNDIIMITYLK